MFDSNGDGAVDAAEWFFLVEFVIVMVFVEATKPKSKIVPEVRAQLPPQLQELLASEQFAAMCAQQFEALDADKSGKLEPTEIAPAIVEMLGAPEYATAVALCGLVKYGGVPSLSNAQKVEGFLANLTGSKDEHTVIGTPGH